MKRGADINAKSSWWAGGTSALQHATGSMLGYNRELAEYLIERGATVDAHAAAGLDMIEKLEALIRENPDVVNAPRDLMACLRSISQRHPALLNCYLHTVPT